MEFLFYTENTYLIINFSELYTKQKEKKTAD